MIRRAEGFRRYAVAVQYHGGSFLGFVQQPRHEDRILPNGTDLRGLRTVERCLKDAVRSLVGEDNFQNFQVSSRTDRGVHAIKNTCHIDIKPRCNSIHKRWDTNELRTGMNHFLAQQATGKSQPSMVNALRVLAVKETPEYMRNRFFDGSEQNGPEFIDWNIRFSATERTYVYRILESDSLSFGVPFEWDRSWRLDTHIKLDIEAMQAGAQHLIGSHDFTSFRGKNCNRPSPIVTIKDIAITSQPHVMAPGLMGESSPGPRLIAVKVSGKSFLYRQVRNMVGCLVSVGRGLLPPCDVKRILETRDRHKAPAMAPAQGLFLADVKHGDFMLCCEPRATNRQIGGSQNEDVASPDSIQT